MLVKLSKGEGVKLYGPIAVTVKEGCISIHGRKTCKDERFVVHKTRNYIVEALENCELEVSMLDESQIQHLEKEDPYWEKKNLVEKIVKEHRRIVVIGCTDCGKSAFVTYVFNAFLEKGKKPAVIDGDVGQANIGPPGFLSLGSSDKQVYWTSELSPVAMRFIGDIKPQYYTHIICRELEFLANYATRLGYTSVIVDTDGWVGDEHAILYKQKLVETLRPDAIVVLGENLDKYFVQYSKLGITIYSVRSPIHRKVRSREERRLLRSLRYRSYLEEAPLVKLSMNKVVVTGLPLLQGSELDVELLSKFVEGKVLYASSLPGALYIYGSVKNYNADELKKLGFEKVKVYQQGFEKSLYCAVEAPGGIDYPCVVEKLDFASREVLVKTKYIGEVSLLKISRIKLSENFLEEYVEV